MQEYSFLMSVYIKEKPEYLVQSIESMLNQTVMPMEIILIEDGSLTDDLYKVIKKYKSEYGNIFNVISLKENVGLGKALNIGIKKCKTELIARMDSDDICLRERCEKQLAEFEKNPELDIVGTQISEFLNDPDNIVSSRIVPETQNEIIEFAKRRSPFNHPTVMYKKTSVLKAGGYSGYGRKEDLELFVKMVNSGFNVMNIGEALLLYRTSDDNLKRRKTWQNCIEYIKIMFGFYKKGYIGNSDMLYVFVGQMTMFLTPEWLLKHLNKKLLRK